MKKGMIAKIVIAAGIVLFLASGYMGYRYSMAVNAREQSVKEINAHLNEYIPSPFENSAMSQTAPPPKKQDEVLYSYQATGSLVFLSHSEEWNEEKLKNLYEELLKNKHGKEIETLHEVTVFPEEEETALAAHASDVVKQGLEIKFGALPSNFKIDFMRDVSLIYLYDGDANNTIESMAWSLSHEYGHLYTFYYFLKKDIYNFGKTEYGKLRKYEEYDLITDHLPDANYDKNHHRYLFETAAEDYVQLMGSPTTRKVVDFPDVREIINGIEIPEDKEYETGYNARPQENYKIPLAREVKGLAEYFYSFIDEKPPIPKEERKEVKLSIQSGSRGYNLAEGYRDFIYYTLEWNTPYKDATYTLVCYDSQEDQLAIIKTVDKLEDAVATIGTLSYESRGYVHYQYDSLDTGTKTFLVMIQLPDGTYYSSEPLTHTF